MADPYFSVSLFHLTGSLQSHDKVACNRVHTKNLMAHPVFMCM
jgi:hypothetical protein